MQLIQIVLTDEQALMLHGASAFAADHAEELGINETELESLKQLSAFMAVAGQEPRKFPVTSMSSTLKTNLRRLKGPAQPQSRRNKRKERQAKRQSYQKRRRAERKVFVEAWNNAVAEYEQMIAEAQAEAETPEARIAAAVAARETQE